MITDADLARLSVVADLAAVTIRLVGRPDGERDHSEATIQRGDLCRFCDAVVDLLTEVRTVRAERDMWMRACGGDALKLRLADRLADEVAVLVRRKVIDSRSPAADRLLDYRDTPSTERADRMAELERDLAAARAEAATCRAIADECLRWDEAVRRAMQREQPSARIADLRSRLASPDPERLRAISQRAHDATSAVANYYSSAQSRGGYARAVDEKNEAWRALDAALGIPPQ